MAYTRHILLVATMITTISFTADIASSQAQAPPPPPAVIEGMEDITIDIEEIKASYDYDHSIPLNIEITEEKDFHSFTKIYFSFDSINGGRVPAVIMIPKPRIKPLKDERATVPGTYPAVFFMHFHVSDKSMADIFSTWPGYGLALMAIDGVFRGDREEKDKDILDPDPEISAQNMRMQIKDILRGFDALSQWEGIDPGRLGFMGVSMGALTGTAATAMDKRIKSIILADGAADFSIMFDNSDYGSLQDIKKYMDDRGYEKRRFVDAFKYVDPAVFAPMITERPVMFMNGEEDTTMSMPAMKKLHESIGTKKTYILWYKSGHILPVEKIPTDAMKWFRRTL